jgi:Domain of unknown function (DUF4112)
MDKLFRIPGVGWRFGVDPIVGLIPGVGDLVTTMISAYVLLTAARYGVPKITLVRMGLNVAVDLLLGIVPGVGDLFDAWWKTNDRNVRLLRERIDTVGRRRATATDWLFVGVVVVAVLAVLWVSLALIGFVLGQLFGALRGLVG